LRERAFYRIRFGSANDNGGDGTSEESNSIEDVGSGLARSEASVCTLYPDFRRDEWRKAIIDLRIGRSRPRAKNVERLAEIAPKMDTIC